MWLLIYQPAERTTRAREGKVDSDNFLSTELSAPNGFSLNSLMDLRWGWKQVALSVMGLDTSRSISLGENRPMHLTGNGFCVKTDSCGNALMDGAKRIRYSLLDRGRNGLMLRLIMDLLSATKWQVNN